MYKQLLTRPRIAKSRESLKDLPTEAGVYIFWQGNTPIYIGKAKNLKNRLSSYFNLQLLPKTRAMVNESDSFSYILVSSELESLLLESHLIRSELPRYNSASRDDKHPLYIRITKEEFPRIITARKTDLKSSKDIFFGPFPSSTNVRGVLSMLRKIFPFSDHKPTKRPCIESHIGMCDPCPSIIANTKDESEKEFLTRIYKYNVRKVKSILSRRISSVMKDLEREMIKYSKDQKYEKAALIRQKIERLNYITQPITPKEFFLQNPDFFEDIRNREIEELKKLLSPHLNLNKLERIECFDIAHLGGTAPTASMVTFVNGVAAKEYYRHFKIRQSKTRDDVASQAEVIKRRIKHLDTWGIPNLIIVDGGKTQTRVFYDELSQKGIPTVGLAKRFETLVVPRKIENKIEFIEIKVPEGPALNLVQRIRNEAHRFARRLHHKLISKNLLPS